MDIARWLDTIRADIQYGVRQLRLNPGFASIAILSLALGIGANTAMFQLINAIRMKTLPVENPEELALIVYAENSSRGGWWSSRSAEFTSLQVATIREQQQAFESLGVWSAGRFDLTTGGEPRFAEGLYVSSDFFSTLGVHAVRGRTITAQDDSDSCDAGAVISDSFWQREFAGDASVLSKTVSLNGQRFPIVGVTPPSFFGVEVGSRFDVAVPMCVDRLMAEDKKGRGGNDAAWWVSVIGRLKPGWTAEKASAHLQSISPALMQAVLPRGYKKDLADRFLKNKLIVRQGGTGVSGLRRQYEGPLFILIGITGLVLLIACANLANLLLARATVREQEIALRMAIGSSRPRIVRQLLTESLILAAAGAILGGAVAYILSTGLLAFINTSDNPVYLSVGIDWRVLGFTALLAIVTCLSFGLLPALRATFTSPISAIRSEGRSVSAGREKFGLRRALVATQVAISLVLIVGAFLFIRSLNNLLSTDPGFHAEGILSVSINFSRAPFGEDRRIDLYRDFQERLAALPGVHSIAQVGFTPVSGNGWDNSVGPDGTPAAGSDKSANFNRASPGYFKTMGTKLLAGRDFTDRDVRESPKVAIVNEQFAQEVFGGKNPVGHTFHLEAPAGEPEQTFEVVGLVANTKYRRLREDFTPIGFFPIAQDARPDSDATYVLRISGSPGRVMERAKATIMEMSPSMAISFQPFSQQLEESILRERLVATLSGGFGLLAGLLATMGLYGVIAYTVERRRGEFGVRMALGANGRDVISLVLKESIVLLGVGLPVGIGLSIWAGQAASTLLFGIQPTDVLTIGAASGLLTVVALIASYIPALKAASASPVSSLRAD
ncbi:MAG: ABC transporter permease [Bryobacterales bacterium]|nr:ABC transporter permease [Bryobacterales bacterium]